MKTKHTLTISILLLLSQYSVYGQKVDTMESNSDSTIVEIIPQPKGGMDAFMNYFKQNLQYPKSALKDKISGTVVVSFVVNTEGRITDCQIVKSIREDLDQEALRLISNAPDWNPGYQKDRYVSVRMSMPIHFYTGRSQPEVAVNFNKKRKTIPLQRVHKNETVDTAYSVIYGNFIQRLGFSSGGFPQYIQLYNIDTEEYFSMLVKPTFKSARENKFCYLIKPGNYILVKYHWIQSKWYGGDTHVEDILKSASSEKRQDINARSQTYSFVVDSASVVYVGTWNFNKSSISFFDDKHNLDEKIKNKYSKLNFKSAKTTIPH